MVLQCWNECKDVSTSDIALSLNGGALPNLDKIIINHCSVSWLCLDYLLPHLPQIPRRLVDEVNQIRSQHAQLLQDADQRTTHIADILRSWEEFQSVRDGLSQWLNTEESELASLGVFPLFLTEFLSLPSRFDVSCMCSWGLIWGLPLDIQECSSLHTVGSISGRAGGLLSSSNGDKGTNKIFLFVFIDRPFNNRNVCFLFWLQ